jgi:hypothetical protein
VKRLALIALVALAGCSNDADLITYVCEEPLENYLDLARANIENDYEVERSRQVLATCPEQGFHRRYRFSFQKSALTSKQSVDAQVQATWCNDPSDKTTRAQLRISPNLFTFRFTYPWSTATGKYPLTEFRLNRNTMRGGFFEDLDWHCRLEQPGT